MLETLSSTKEGLLHLLLARRGEGATLEELSNELGITRNAVQQHVTALERDGLVEPIGMRPTSRRPSRVYGLTTEGGEKFPRHYDLLALGTLEAVCESLGDEATETVLHAMAEKLAQPWLTELEGLDEENRRARVAEIMSSLGFHPQPHSDGIAAINCVFHKVAQKTSAVCKFDEKLLSRLLGAKVLLSSCMAEGDGMCAFSRFATESRARDRRK